MVQSSRLKQKFHPLAPIFLILLMVLIGLFFWVKILDVFNNQLFARYEQDRNETLLLISSLKGQLSETIPINSKLNSSFLADLNASYDISEKVLEEYDRLIVRQSNIYKGALSLEKKELLNQNLDSDIEERQNVYNFSLLLQRKINALDLYFKLKDVDSCIKKIKDSSSSLFCKSYLKDLASLKDFNSTLYEKYLLSANNLIENYLSYSTVERIKGINYLVDIHNRFNSLIEAELNSSI